MWARDADERNRLWKARHDILYACMALKPGSKVRLDFGLNYLIKLMFETINLA